MKKSAGYNEFITITFTFFFRGKKKLQATGIFCGNVYKKIATPFRWFKKKCFTN